MEEKLYHYTVYYSGSKDVNGPKLIKGKIEVIAKNNEDASINADKEILEKIAKGIIEDISIFVIDAIVRQD